MWARPEDRGPGAACVASLAKSKVDMGKDRIMGGEDETVSTGKEACSSAGDTKRSQRGKPVLTEQS